MADSSAHAGVVDLSCTGGYTATYSPGLTFEEKETVITRDGTLSTCVPLLTDATIVSGRGSSKVTVNASCNSANTPPYDLKYNWSNGQSSTIHFSSTVQQKPAGDTVFISTGIVTDGEFKNDMATRTLTLATLDSTQCLSTGVSSATGNETLVLTGQ
ncbi:MAG: hypothetical protein KME46_34295 [Brasilonema angustatum HA4187-MV1]|nr:hypothetical protein [Brasilonema angustatum HA4187-MV1]